MHVRHIFAVLRSWWCMWEGQTLEPPWDGRLPIISHEYRARCLCFSFLSRPHITLNTTDEYTVAAGSPQLFLEAYTGFSPAVFFFPLSFARTMTMTGQHRPLLLLIVLALYALENQVRALPAAPAKSLKVVPAPSARKADVTHKLNTIDMMIAVRAW